MSTQSKELSPVPQHDPPLGNFSGVQRFVNSWMQWFIELRTKVNVINALLINFSNLSGQGFPSLDGDEFNIRTMQVGPRGGIEILNGDGVAGDPEFQLDNPADGQIYGRQNDSWVVAPASAITYPRILSAAALRP